MKLFLAALLLLSADISAYSATQSNWTIGHQLGPFTAWGNNYYSMSGLCSWMTVLRLTGEVNIVDGSFGGPRSVACADLDGDGDVDIAAAGLESNTIAWWENCGGEPPVWIEHVLADNLREARAVAIGDIDGDGRLDVVGAGHTAWRIDWWRNPGPGPTVWQRNNITTDAPTIWFIRLADVDGDGSLDVIGILNDLGQIYWWDNSLAPGTFWRRRGIAADFLNPRSCCASDIDGDGDIDVVGAAYESDASSTSLIENRVAWWENIDGSGVGWLYHDLVSSYKAHSVCAGDIDGDGDQDIVVGADVFRKAINWYEQVSPGVWTEHLVNYDFEWARSVFLADVDVDGDLDIVASAYDWTEGHLLAWFENAWAQGMTWVPHFSCVEFMGAYDACAADITGDERLEIVGCAHQDNEIVWCTSYYDTQGILESSILDTGFECNWGYVDLTASVPPATSIMLRARSSDDWAQMGEWSDPFQPPCDLDPVLEDGGRYLQYQVMLGTSAALVTPMMEDITFSWVPVGIGGDQESVPGDGFALDVSPNPALGRPSLQISLPSPSWVALSVFDCSGREMHGISQFLPAGSSQLELPAFPPGVYFVRMTSGDFEESERFVEVE